MAVALAVGAVTIRGAAAQRDVPGRIVVGLTVGALAGAIGVVLYAALEYLPGGEQPPPEPLLQSLHLAATGLVVAGSFARLVPHAKPVECRLAAVGGASCRGCWRARSSATRMASSGRSPWPRRPSAW